jgi:hypothetical protein
LKTHILVKKSLIVAALLMNAVLQLAAQGPATFEFVENKGQWDKQVTFKGGNFFLQKNGFTVVQHNTTDLQLARDHHRQLGENGTNVPAPNKNAPALNNIRLRTTDSGLTIR